jgi:hypothetical protein
VHDASPYPVFLYPGRFGKCVFDAVQNQVTERYRVKTIIGSVIKGGKERTFGDVGTLGNNVMHMQAAVKPVPWMTLMVKH